MPITHLPAVGQVASCLLAHGVDDQHLDAVLNTLATMCGIETITLQEAARRKPALQGLLAGSNH
jgi:hypothetical protein